MKTETDERKGIPSASGLADILLCPGKPNAERGLPELPKEDGDEDAERGVRIHAAKETGDKSGLSPEEEEIYDKMTDQEEELLRRFGGSVWEHREQRLWLYGDHLQPIFSGRFDVIYFTSDGALLVIDYKTGRNAADDAEINMQLRAAAVLASEEHGMRTVRAAIIQPLVSGKPKVVLYIGEDIDRAEEELRGILAKAREPDAPRIPGAQCKYCRARLTCPEALAGVGVVTVLEPSLPAMTGPQLADFLTSCEAAMHVIKAARGKAREMLMEDRQSVPGWTLAEGPAKRKVTNAGRLYENVSAHGVSAEQYAAACSVTITAITGALKTATGKKGKDLTALVNASLEGCVTMSKPALSLVKAGESIQQIED